MEAQNNIRQHVQFNRGNAYQQSRRAGLNINHIKFDLLKISELYDGVLTSELGHTPLYLYNQYLTDLVKDGMIYGYGIDLPELRTHEETGSQSFTYTIHIQSAMDRASKALKIHVGFYKSPLFTETFHNANGMCCMPNRLDRSQ